METLKIMATPFKGPMQAPQLSIPTSPAAGPRRPRLCQRLRHTHRRVWVSLLWGHCSFLLGPGAHKVSFVPSKSLFLPSLCKFWLLYGGVNGDLLQEGLCHTQVYCTQSPCLCGRPLLTHTSAGDTQTQFCLSLCGISGSQWHKVCLNPPSISSWYGV